jgi:hypothetical protein
MTRWPPADDGELLGELRGALDEARQVPADHLSAARAAFAWRTIDDELAVAELVFDSACDPAPAGQLRSTASARLLTFRHGEVVLEIEVTEEGIAGQLSPPAAGRVTAGTATGDYDRTEIDPVGYFTLAPAPRGPVRLRATTAGFTVTTSWVCLS